MWVLFALPIKILSIPLYKHYTLLNILLKVSNRNWYHPCYILWNLSFPSPDEHGPIFNWGYYYCRNGPQWPFVQNLRAGEIMVNEDVQLCWSDIFPHKRYENVDGCVAARYLLWNISIDKLNTFSIQVPSSLISLQYVILADMIPITFDHFNGFKNLFIQFQWSKWQLLSYFTSAVNIPALCSSSFQRN